MSIVIKSIKGLKFALPNARKGGYAYSTGLAFYDTTTNEWIAGNKKTKDGKNISTEFPYVPLGGRRGLKIILADSGTFFETQPRVKSL